MNKRNFFAVLVAVLLANCTTPLYPDSLSQNEPNKPKIVEIEIRKRGKNKSWCLSEIAKDLGTDWREIAKLNNLSDPNKIYPGQKLKVIPYNRNPIAEVSWYGPECQGKLMANREPFDMNDPTIVAHKWLPIGTKVQLTRLDNDVSIVVVVKDRGPYYKDRSFDLSMAAAGQLGMIEKGHAKCRVNLGPAK